MTAIYFTNLFVNFEGENERKKKKKDEIKQGENKNNKREQT